MKSVEFIAANYDDQKKENEALHGKIAILEERQEMMKSKCRAYEESFLEQADQIDALEQYSRRNCLLLHGIPEAVDEKTDDLVRSTIASNLDINIKAKAIDRSHRLGKPKTDGKPRPIIAKFVRYNARRNVFVNKKSFKGSNIMVTESLTLRRVKMLNAAREKFGNKNVWSIDGEVMAKDGNNIVKVREL